MDLRRKMTSEIRRFSSEQADRFLQDFNSLKLFDDFESENFFYFEKIELIYSCNVIIYSSDNYEEYSFKTNFPKNWKEFGEILKDLFGFDVLHLNYQKQMVTPLYYDVLPDGVYFNGDKLKVRTIEFGHYQTYPYDIPKPRLIIDFKQKRIEGYIEKELTGPDEDKILDILERHHVYMWIFDGYHRKSNARDPDDLEGYDWYLEIVFEGDVIWHIFGYNEYPDTYVHLAREVIDITGMDLLEMNTISEGDLELFNKFGNDILS